MKETRPGSISLKEAIGQLGRLHPETRNLVVSLIGRLAQSEGGLDHPDRGLPIPRWLRAEEPQVGARQVTTDSGRVVPCTHSSVHFSLRRD